MNKELQISVADVLQNVSHEELRHFVIDQAKHNSDLTQAIMLRFAEKLKPAKEENSDNKYAKMIRQSLAEVDADYDDEDYYYNEEYCVDLEVLDGWAKKAKTLLNEDKFMDTEQICKAAIEEFAEWFEEKKDSYTDISLDDCISNDYQNDFVEILKNLAQNRQTDKKQLYEWCKTEIAKEKYTHIQSFNLLNDLMAELAPDVNPADFVALQEKLLKQISDKSSHEAETILQRLINFYNANNQQDKAGKIVEDNLLIDSFRKIAVEKRIADGQFAEAKKLLNEKLQNCDNWRQNEWKELLLTIAQKEKDVPEIRRIALEFLENGFNNEHFTIYKKAFLAEEWTVAFENLFDCYNKPKNQYDKGFRRDVADLLKAENLTERLLIYCETHWSLDNLKHYHTFFAAQFPEKTLVLFQKLLDWYAEKNTGRDKYEYMVGIMKLMQKIVGGQQVVKAMIENYRAIYKNRRAMMEIFSNFAK